MKTLLGMKWWLCGAAILAFAGRTFAEPDDLNAWFTAALDAQKARYLKVSPAAAANDVAVERDMRQLTRDFAAQHLPLKALGLKEVPDAVTTAMELSGAKVGRMAFTAADGTRHVFSSWIAAKIQRPLVWMADGYPAQTSPDVAALAKLLGRTLLAVRPDGQYVLRSVAKPMDKSAVAKGEFSGKTYGSPFDRAYVVFIDDNPLANWGHACRLVFVKDDLSAFAVWHLNEPLVIVRDSDEVEMERIGGNVEEAPAPSIDEIRQTVAPSNALGAGNGIVADGDVAHSYAILISGGYNRNNNHTRYWGDTAAVYGALTRVYGIPKDHITVCMSDGTSSGADVSYGTSSSQSHGEFSGNSSPLDLDGDRLADVGYDATKASVQTAFSSLRSKLTANDQLFVFVTDHGSQDSDSGACFVCLWNSTMMSVADFAALTSGLPCPVLFAFEFCYSGAFINALTSQSGGRAVATAANVETSSGWNKTSSVTGVTSSQGGKYMNPWVYYFVGAVRGVFPAVSISPWNASAYPCAADTSGDGRVSLREASDYAKSKIIADRYPETPNYGESTSGIGSSFFIVKRTTGTAPANDNFASAPALVGLSGTKTGTNVGATFQSGEPLLAYQPTATTTVWWKWIAPANGSVQFDTIGTSFDTVMGVYKGTSLSSLAKVVEDDNGGGNYTSKCVFNGASGTTYYICVGGKDAKSGAITLNWKQNLALSSIAISGSSSVKSGGTTTYVCTATMNDGTTKTVTPTWTIISGADFATINSSGTLLAGAVAVQKSVTIQASYTEGGVTKTATKTVTIAALSSLSISGSASVLGGSSSTYTCTAKWSDGTSTTVTPTWTIVSGASYASISSSGKLTTVAVTSQKSVTIQASYKAGGVTKTATKTVTITVPITLGTAVDNADLTFTTGGSASWFGQTATTHDGVDAARSGSITHSQNSWMQTTVTGPGTISFWWSVSSESGCDCLEFLVDGTVRNSISGTGGTWTQMSYSITSGSHTLQWRYRKDVSVSSGLDAGFVDQVTWTTSQGVPTAPTVSISTWGTDKSNTSYVKIDWTGGSGATSYNLYRSTSNSRPSTPVKTNVTSPYYDYKSTSGLIPGVKYYYWVSAVNSAGTAYSATDWGNILVSLDLGSTSKSFAAAGGSTSAPVTANTSWSAAATASWIAFGTSSGSGNGTLAFTVKENTTSESRSGVITVTAGSGTDFPVTKTILVSQAGVSGPKTLYVAANGSDAHSGTESSPLATIQKAIDMSNEGDTIIVGDGRYEPIADAPGGVTIRSVNGASKTFIDGSMQWSRGVSNQCARLMVSVVLKGFTLVNGRSRSTQNAVLRGGGGVYGGTLEDCVISNNVATSGGGAYMSVLKRCLICDNEAVVGGGCADCDEGVSDCVIVRNKAQEGGGATCCVLNNCVICKNTADEGIVAEECYLRNCIVWGNSCSGNAIDDSSECLCSCVDEAVPGTGNILADPKFADLAHDDYRLLRGSPCIDAGSNEYVSGAVDADGLPRIVNGTVDMGAYEWQWVVVPRGQGSDVLIPTDWFLTGKIGGTQVFDPGKFVSLFGSDYAVAAQAKTGKVDARGKPMYVWQDFVAGTDPTDKKSVFTAHISFDGGRPIITWTPDLNQGNAAPLRTYRTMGVNDLSRAADPAAWREVAPGRESDYRFFRVTVDMGE